MRSPKTLACLALAPLALAALAGPAAAAAIHVHIVNFAFSPRVITVALGDTITWNNHDGAAHTATDVNCPRAGGPGPCEFDSLNMAQNAVFTHTFNTAATFGYKCTIHGFTGTITVSGATNLADLEIAQLTATDETFGATKRVDFTVHNQGQVASAASTARLSYLYKNQLFTIEDVPVPALAAGASSPHSVVWTPLAKVGDFTLQAKADQPNAVAEVSNDNNLRETVTSVLLPPGTLPGKDLTNP